MACNTDNDDCESSLDLSSSFNRREDPILKSFKSLVDLGKVIENFNNLKEFHLGEIDANFTQIKFQVEKQMLELKKNLNEEANELNLYLARFKNICKRNFDEYKSTSKRKTARIERDKTESNIRKSVTEWEMAITQAIQAKSMNAELLLSILKQSEEAQIQVIKDIELTRDEIFEDELDFLNNTIQNFTKKNGLAQWNEWILNELKMAPNKLI